VPEPQLQLARLPAARLPVARQRVAVAAPPLLAAAAQGRQLAARLEQPVAALRVRVRVRVKVAAPASTPVRVAKRLAADRVQVLAAKPGAAAAASR
jgi:hypothetical protein